MNFSFIVIIAAVTVNCLVTTINGKSAANSIAVPYIDTLLPPLEDKQDNGNKDAPAEINVTTKGTFAFETTTKAILSTTTTTTKKPFIKYENNILAKPSIEALLPPLFTAQTEKEETTTVKARTTTTKATTRITTTTERPTTTTTKRLTTTSKPFYRTSTTTIKPKLRVPDLFLEPLLPPALHKDSTDKHLTPTTTTQKSTTTTTTQKLQKQQLTKYSQVKTAGSQIENKPALKTKQNSETQTFDKQVYFTSGLQNNKLQNRDEIVKPQYVAKEKVSNSKYVDKQFNYSFDLYLRSTTQKPPKNGLPTITPFPHRLGK